MRRPLLALLLGMALSGPALGVNPDEVLSDPALEERARQLSRGLRCVVCQNQSIDDSDADMARTMRVAVRERLAAGDTDAEVRDWMVARHGDYVLLRPPVRLGTILLWVAPALLLVGGGLVVLRRARRTGPAADRLTDDEERALARLTRGG